MPNHLTYSISYSIFSFNPPPTSWKIWLYWRQSRSPGNMGKQKLTLCSITRAKYHDSYVLITAAGSYALSIWLGVRIGPFRRAAKVPHPITYASVETIANASSPEEKRALYLFNC